MTKNTPQLMSREAFELRLVNIETLYAIAFEGAKTMTQSDRINSAREIAKQRTMNMMVDKSICQLEEEANITVAVSREERVGQVPFPPKINHRLTMVNWENSR